MEEVFFYSLYCLLFFYGKRNTFKNSGRCNDFGFSESQFEFGNKHVLSGNH